VPVTGGNVSFYNQTGTRAFTHWPGATSQPGSFSDVR
jgi:hypothetical protein